MREKDLCDSPQLCNDHPTQHADDCPISLLADATQSVAGQLLDRALSLDFALDKGFHIDLSDTPADEFNAIRVLKIEQNKLEREQQEKDKHNGASANRH